MKYKRNRLSEENPGHITDLMDCHKNYIVTGNFVHIRNTEYTGTVFWNASAKCFGVFLGCWYLDQNPYDLNCYGKFIHIPQDNGMRIELEILY